MPNIKSAKKRVKVTAAKTMQNKMFRTQLKTEMKKFQSGQIIMLVIAGVSLLLGALAVFGISTKRREE